MAGAVLSAFCVFNSCNHQDTPLRHVLFYSHFKDEETEAREGNWGTGRIQTPSQSHSLKGGRNRIKRVWLWSWVLGHIFCFSTLWWIRSFFFIPGGFSLELHLQASYKWSPFSQTQKLLESHYLWEEEGLFYFTFGSKHSICMILQSNVSASRIVL